MIPAPKRDEVEAVALALEALRAAEKSLNRWDAPETYRHIQAAIAALDEEDSEPIARIAELLTNRLPFVKDGNMADLARVVYALAVPDGSRARDNGDGWKPIDSAPKDGTRILGAQQHTVEVIFWAGEWFNQSAEMSLWAAFPPTHWRELPVPPDEIIAPAPSQSEAIRAEVIAQGVDPNSDKAERMGRAARQNVLGKAER